MAIKVCVITSTSHLFVYPELGDMDMSLSHLILQDEAYAGYYREQSNKGRYVLLDNSAFELEQQGKGLDPDPVLDAAEITNPSEVIATDVLFKGQETLESTREFIAAMRRRDLIGRYKVMGVVQGRTQDEWLGCLEGLLSIPEINVIGLSKLSVPMSFLGEKESSGNVARARLECTRKIQKRIDTARVLNRAVLPFQRLGRDVQVHLLGADNWCVYEMRQQVKYPWIRSNDSSCAVWYGSYGDVYDKEGKIENIRLDKPDLENSNESVRDRIDRNDYLIKENIRLWKEACNG